MELAVFSNSSHAIQGTPFQPFIMTLSQTPSSGSSSTTKMLKLFFRKIFQWLTIQNLVSKTWQVQPISPGCSITHTHRSLVLLQVANDSLASTSLFLLVHIAWNVIYPHPHTHTPNCKTPICLQISPNVTSLQSAFPLWFTGWRVKWLNVSVLESMTCYFNHPCIPVSTLLCCPRKCASIEPLLLWISNFFCMLAQSSARKHVLNKFPQMN